MIVLSITLLSFGSADLVRWSPDRVSSRRTAAAVLGALVVTLVPVSLSGLPALDVALVEASTLLVVLVWLLFDRPVLRKVGPGYQLAWIAIAVMVAFASSGATSSISGPLRNWYSSLPFGFVRTISIDPFLLGVSAALFVLATANRIVRLVLQAAGTPAREGRNHTERRTNPWAHGASLCSCDGRIWEPHGGRRADSSKGTVATPRDSQQLGAARRSWRSSDRVFPHRHVLQPFDRQCAWNPCIRLRLIPSRLLARH